MWVGHWDVGGYTLGTSFERFPRSLDPVSLHERTYLIDPTRLPSFLPIPNMDGLLLCDPHFSVSHVA